MCGITGWVDWQKDLSLQGETFSGMTESLAHRGPDAAGTYIARHAMLGHRRLSVVDPEGGAQPMHRTVRGHTYVIVYNGELYNTPELRAELEQRGHRFDGHSDTEVLLAAFTEWKEQCLARLNGIFAFAVWDEREEKLFLARDRLGVKPLFYAERGSSFVFGSELKALLKSGLVKPVIDGAGLAEIFVMGPSRTPGHGIFKGVHELKPGCFMWVDRHGLGCEQPYWQLVSREHDDDLATTVRRVRELVEEAAQRQLVADVPVATFLSGGVDSSALTAIAASSFATSGKEPLSTFSVDYAENELYFQKSSFIPNADAMYIRLVSERLGTVHHTVSLDNSELAAALYEATRARDLPGMADVDSSLLLFCREVKKNVTVVLSGECADEVFGGYPWFKKPEQEETFPWIRNLDERMALLRPEITALMKPQEYLKERFHQAKSEVPGLPGESEKEARMREMFYLNITRFMPTLLDRKDRMSMAVGLEARVPYCDHRLVEYAWNIPWEMKNTGGQEKAILRLALKGLVPDEVLNRKKSPYPKTHHPEYLRAVRQKVLSILADKDAPVKRFVEQDALRRFALSDTASAHFPWFGQLMGGPQLLAYMCQVNHWLKEYNVEMEESVAVV